MSQLLFNKSFAESNFNNINLDKLDFVFDYLIENKKFQSTILVLPTKKYTDEMKRRFLRKYKQATPNLLFLTLQEFAKQCLEKILSDNYQNIKFINETSSLILIEKVIEEEKNNLEYYSHPVQLPVLKKITNVILGLKEDGITPQNIDNEYSEEQKVASAQKRFNDLCRIYTQYENKIQGKYLDNTDILYKIIEEVNKNQQPVDSILNKDTSNFILDEKIPNIDAIFFYGFSEFKFPEAKFLSIFTKSKIPVAIYINYSAIEGPNIDLLPKNTKRLVTNWFNELSDFSHKKYTDKTLLSYINKNLFNQNLLEVEKNIQLRKAISDKIHIIEAKDRTDEMKNIVNLVHSLIDEKQQENEKINLSEICICSRMSSKYTALAREFFSESNLPINISDRFPLSTSNVITFILSLIEISISGINRENLLKISETIFLEQDNLDIKLLIKLGDNFRLWTSGKKSKNQIKHWTKMLEHYYQIVQQNQEENNSIDINEIKKGKEVLEKLNNKLYLIKQKKCTAKELAEIIKQNIIKELKIAHIILQQYKNIYNNNNISEIEKFQYLEEIEKNAKSLTKFIEVLDDFADIFDKENQGKEYSIKYIFDRLTLAISAERYQLSEKNGLGVTITDLEQTRGIPYKIIILCGAVEGEFPLKFQTDTFLGKDLPDSEEIHNDNEKMLFYYFLTNNLEDADGIYIFYPKSDSKKEHIRSYFIDELIRILPEKSIIKTNDSENPNNKSFKWLNAKSQHLEILNYYYLNEETENNINEKYKVRIHKLNELAQFDCCETQKKQNLESLKSTLREKTYSISELEKYIKCSFLYFLERIGKIKPEDDFTESITGLELGNYIHKVLYRFYTEALEKFETSDENYENFNEYFRNKSSDLKEQLYHIAEEEKLEFDVPIFKYEIERANQVLSIWFDNEIKKLSSWDFTAISFEEEFGDRRNGLELALSSDKDRTIKTFGKVDRVELASDNRFLVADYKTSKASVATRSSILNGTSLQLPIYLLALKKKYCEKNWEPSDGVYYSLASNDDKFLHEPFRRIDNLEETLENSLEVAIKTKEKIENLEFEIPKKPDCIYCSYNTVCRKNQIVLSEDSEQD